MTICNKHHSPRFCNSAPSFLNVFSSFVFVATTSRPIYIPCFSTSTISSEWTKAYLSPGRRLQSISSFVSSHVLDFSLAIIPLKKHPLYFVLNFKCNHDHCRYSNDHLTIDIIDRSYINIREEFCSVSFQTIIVSIISSIISIIIISKHPFHQFQNFPIQIMVV